jgi:hypothetical protein
MLTARPRAMRVTAPPVPAVPVRVTTVTVTVARTAVLRFPDVLEVDASPAFAVTSSVSAGQR